MDEIKIKVNKNYGLIPADLEPEDWRFGSSKLGLEVRREDGDWTDYLPTGEKQRRADEDKMWCVAASAENTCETEFNYMIDKKLISPDDYQWLRKNAYIDGNGKLDTCDRFIAILSGTTGSGNTPKKVAHAIHKYGLVPEKMLPYRRAMTFKQCYGYGKNETPNTKLITQEMIDLGQEFLKRFPINYEFIQGGKSEYDRVRRYNPIQVFVFAWNGRNSKGEYIRVNSGYNHAVENHNLNQIYDTYDPFIKNLAPDFDYMSYGTRFIIQFKKKEGEKYMLQRKKGTQEVYLVMNGERVWIKSEKDFELLKQSQPIKDIEWFNIREVDNFDIPFEGRILGKPDFSISDLLKMLFGKLTGK